MKKYILTVSIILLLVSVFCFNEKKSCTCSLLAAEKHASVQMTTPGYQVTFLELGSVKCIPCKMMQPVMDDIEKEYAGKVNVVFHDVWTEEGEPYAQKYGIAGIPTQIFLDKDGKEFFRHTGFLAKNKIEQVLEKQGVTK